MLKKQLNFWAKFWENEEVISLQQLIGMDYNWAGKKAYELGSGKGYDTLSLLQNNWNVIAVDKEEGSYENIKRQLTSVQANKLAFLNQCFEELELSRCDLIHAKFSLPFCKSKHAFNTLWKAIEMNLEEGGFFCGQLFGIEDDWRETHPLVFHTRQEVEFLIKNFEVVQFLEIKKNAPTLNNGVKNWHVYHLILRKKLA